jgi:hypothetical protein
MCEVSFFADFIGAIDILANATFHVLESDACSEVTKETVHRCVTGPRVMKEIEKLEQMSGPKLFGFGQDHAGLNYTIFRFGSRLCDTLENRTILGVYENASKKLSLWADIVFADKLGGNRSVQKVQSTCRDECKPHWRRVLKKPSKCSWTCKPCGRYEIVIGDFTRCDICPLAKPVFQLHHMLRSNT